MLTLLESIYSLEDLSFLAVVFSTRVLPARESLSCTKSEFLPLIGLIYYPEDYSSLAPKSSSCARGMP